MFLRRAVASLVTLVALASANPSLAVPPTKKPIATPEAAAAVPEEAAKLIERAIATGKAQKFEEAVDLLEQALAVIEKKLGKDHYLLGNTLNLLTQIEMILGHLDVAEKHAERSIKVLAKDVNADPLRLGHALIRRAELHGRRGEGDKEVELRKLVITLFEKAFGAEKMDAMAEVLALAKTLTHLGRYSEAKIYFDRWIGVIEKQFGLDEPVLVEILLDYSINEAEAGHYDAAEALLVRALGIRKKEGRGDDAQVTVILNNMAEVAYQRGDYSKAEALYKRVLAVYESTTGIHPQTLGIALGNLGAVQIDRGDIKGGLPLLRRSLEIQEKHFGSDHAALTGPLTNLGEALLRTRRMDESLPYLERALALREKALGPHHPKIVTQLINMGSILLEQGNVPVAELYFARSLAIQEKSLGPTHPLLFNTLQALGMIEQGKNHFDKAEELHRRAMEVLEKAFGPMHPQIVEPLKSLAVLLRVRGDLEGARKAFERAGEIAERHTARMLAGGSEAQKLAWLSTIEPLWQQTVDHHLRHEPKEPGAARLSLDATLRRKGRALDAVAGSLSTLRRNLSPEDQEIFGKLRDAQQKLAAMTMRGAGENDAQAWRAAVETLEKDVALLENKVSEKSAAYRIETQTATVVGVQAMLPKDAAYIEIVRHRPVAAGIRAAAKPEQYTAYILAASGDPQAIELGDALAIDDAVMKLRDALADPSRTDVKELSRLLDEKLARPLRGLLGSAKRLIVAPDGALDFIPFEALVDETGHYMVERWSISYVTSGRDMFRWSRHAPSRSGPVIFANPAFGEIVKQPKKEGATRGDDATGISRLGFTPLSGTAEEGQSIVKQLSGAKLHVGGMATKDRIVALAGPKILHIATHGFFMGEALEVTPTNTRGFSIEGDAPPPPIVRSMEVVPPSKASPLLRSGLALSGANAHGDDRSAGILTALEASGLDLEGTKLVVLSACETGLGQARNGEGVEGLRRAFVLAGAETTVMSLWKVDDEATRDMMIAYYQRLEGGEGRSEALRQVRLGLLAKNSTSHPFYWASFIVAGDPSRIDGTMPAAPPPVSPGQRGCACLLAGHSADEDFGRAVSIFVAGGVVWQLRRRRLS